MNAVIIEYFPKAENRFFYYAKELKFIAPPIFGMLASGVTTLGPAGAQPHHRVFEPHHPYFEVSELLNQNE